MSRPGAGAGAAPRGLPTLTALRAGAAALVFAYHLSRIVVPVPLADVGYAGVAFFFVLSGFVLTWSYRPEGSWGGFMVRRVARVFPSHLVVMGVALILSASLLPATVTPGMVASQTLLVQAWLFDPETILGINMVSWSLSAEMAFYALFPLLVPALLRMRPRLRAVCAMVLLAIPVVLGTVLTAAGSPEAARLLYFDPLARVPEFVLGIVIALIVRAGQAPVLPRGTAILPVAAAWIACSVTAVPEFVGNAALALAFAVIICEAARRDVARASGGRGRAPARWAQFLGRISFAFYLVHVLAMQLVVAYLPVPAGVRAVVALVLATAAAVLLHIWVEKPAQRWVMTGWIKLREISSSRTGSAVLRSGTLAAERSDGEARR
ncbi:acyltransferase [Microbacterium oryzae]|uniref:acyltransferase family protein n=1 Tax=Microbacterium oryzae TaxID=743009 RepID=UPI0025B19C1F|nr:acyltransferase [Microbacterium oryzae]MDN3310106.1 acyltransferase [Microbacterium oryzae]